MDLRRRLTEEMASGFASQSPMAMESRGKLEAEPDVTLSAEQTSDNANDVSDSWMSSYSTDFLLNCEVPGK